MNINAIVILMCNIVKCVCVVILMIINEWCVLMKVTNDNEILLVMTNDVIQWNINEVVILVLLLLCNIEMIMTIINDDIDYYY